MGAGCILRGMSTRTGTFKRSADVPREAHRLDVSKADLLEAAWELASLCNDGDGPGDVPATYRKLVETLNGARARRESGRVRAFTGQRQPRSVDARHGRPVRGRPGVVADPVADRRGDIVTLAHRERSG